MEGTCRILVAVAALLSIAEFCNAQEDQEQLKAFSLDTSENIGREWTIDQAHCFYDQGLRDLKYAWGCNGPNNVTELGQMSGFWSSCQNPICSITFYNADFVPGILIIKSVVRGGGQIKIFARDYPQSENLYDLVHVITEEDNGEINVNLAGFGKSKALKFEITRTNTGRGYVFLDSVEILEHSFGQRNISGDASSFRIGKPSSFPLIVGIFSFLIVQLFAQLIKH